jgi:hypothetical protein
MKNEVQAGFFICSLVPIAMGILVLFAAIGNAKSANSRQVHHEQ